MNRDDLKKAYSEVASRAGNGDKALAELITEVVNPNHITFDVFSSFMPVERYNPGDYINKRIRKGRFRARQMIPGAQHLTDAIVYKTQFNYMFDRLIAGYSGNLMEIKRGELGTLEEIKREVRADLIDECVSKVFNLLTTVWNSTSTPSNFVNATSTGLTATNLDSAMENLIEKAGNIRAIIGTRRALLPLYSFAGYKDVLLADGSTREALPLTELLMERQRTNRISLYNGTTVVEIPQILENRLPTINRKLVRDDVVLLVAENAGSIALMGDPEEQEHTDTSKQPADYVYHTWQQWGLLVDRPEYLSVIEVS